MADTTRTTIASGSSSVSVIAPTDGLRLIGFSITEDAGSPAAAKVSIQEGSSAQIVNEIAGVNLVASESVREWYGDYGIPCPGGLYLSRVSGTCRAVFYTRVSDRGKQSYDPPSW